MTTELKTGVIICRCGAYISDFIDIPQVLEYARKLPYVVYSNDEEHLCSEEGLMHLSESIKENGLSRMVVAACSPHIRKMMIDIACADAELSPYLVEWVNVREQCAWVHSDEPKKATEKVIDLIGIAVAKVPTLRSFLAPSVDVNEGLCTGCGICVRICPFGGMQKDEMGTARVNEFLCVGCGVCGASCPERAITVQNFTDDQVMAQAMVAVKGTRLHHLNI